jgi:hypothetical protein
MNATSHDFLGLGMRPEQEGLAVLRARIIAELPQRQARVAHALLVDGPEFDPPEAPVTYDLIAEAFGISVPTVREHLRRIARRHPELYASLMDERRRRFERWHLDVAERRRERSRRWGKRRWAYRYKARTGNWPWEILGRGGGL